MLMLTSSTALGAETTACTRLASYPAVSLKETPGVHCSHMRVISTFYCVTLRHMTMVVGRGL